MRENQEVGLLKHINALSYLQGWPAVLVIALLVMLPLYIYGMPYGLDLPHHYRIAQGFYDSLTSGNFYPSWLPSTNGGYGDPSVRFYPPALYYLFASASWLTG